MSTMHGPIYCAPCCTCYTACCVLVVQVKQGHKKIDQLLSRSQPAKGANQLSPGATARFVKSALAKKTREQLPSFASVAS